jgi:hypothetical protein
MHEAMLYTVATACVLVLALLLGIGLDLQYRALPRRAKALAAGKSRLDKLA